MRDCRIEARANTAASSILSLSLFSLFINSAGFLNLFSPPAPQFHTRATLIGEKHNFFCSMHSVPFFFFHAAITRSRDNKLLLNIRHCFSGAPAAETRRRRRNGIRGW